MALTFCFTDIESSTRLLGRLGTDAYEQLQDIQRAILRRAWADHGGHEVRSEGDGSFVVFEHAVDAVAACLEAQLELRQQNWPAGNEVRVRMGLHTGDANPTADGDYVGLGVHHAARVGDAANGGQIIVSAATADAVAALPEFAGLLDLGSYRLKDVDDAVRLFAVEHPDLERDPRPPRAPSSAVHNLPIVRTAFVGRSEEMKEIDKLIALHPLVTVTGAGGVGKTRLAIEAASLATASLAHGAWLVELAPITAGASVGPQIAAALNVSVEPEQPVIDLLIDALREQELLLVLDNCEHVIEAVAGIADTLLRSCKNVKILATSREPLRVRGEMAWRLPSLAIDDAVQLFTDRAAVAAPAMMLDTELVQRICERLDGIPLALELAAARLRTMSLGDLATSLDDRFTSLVGGYRTDLPRQQTLRATIDWSYDLLDADERTLFARMSVFPTTCRLPFIEEICGEGIDVVPTLSSLVDRSLLQPTDEAYQMLESIHAYATERLADSGERDTIRERHRQSLLAFIKVATLKQLIQARENVRAALAFKVDATMLEVALHSADLWFRNGPWDEGRRWSETALDANPEPSATRAGALGALTNVLTAMGLIAEGMAAHEEALAFHRSVGDAQQIAFGEYGLAELALMSNDFAQAKELVGAVLAYDIDDGGDLRARCEYVLAYVAAIENRPLDGIAHARAAMEGFAANDSLHFVEVARAQLAQLETIAGLHEDACAHFQESIAYHERSGDRGNVAHTAWHFGKLLVAMGRTDEGVAHLATARDMSAEMGDAFAPLMAASYGHGLYLSGQRDEGRNEMDRAIALMDDPAFRSTMPNALAMRADLSILDGDAARAISIATQAFDELIAINNEIDAITALSKIAAAVSYNGDHERAAKLFGVVAAQVGENGLLAEAADQPAQVAIRATQTALGTDVAAWAAAASTIDLADALKI